MAGQVGAPEAYEFNEGLNMSDGMQNYAKENNYSNDALNSWAEAYQADAESTREAYRGEQIELLGKDADARLTNVEDWAKANLGDDYTDTLNAMVSTAKGVEVFEKIMKMNSGVAPAQVEQPKQMLDRDTVRSMQFAKDEYGNRKMSSDPQYRAKVEGMMNEFIASGGKL